MGRSVAFCVVSEPGLVTFGGAPVSHRRRSISCGTNSGEKFRNIGGHLFDSQIVFAVWPQFQNHFGARRVIVEFGFDKAFGINDKFCHLLLGPNKTGLSGGNQKFGVAVIFADTGLTTNDAIKVWPGFGTTASDCVAVVVTNNVAVLTELKGGLA